MCFIRFFRSASLCVSLLNCAFLGAQTEGGLLERLASEKRAAMLERFGDGAEMSAEIEQALSATSRKDLRRVDRTGVDAAIGRLLKLDVSMMTSKERSRLAKAWRKAAEFTKKMDGPSLEMLDLLERAHVLDPEDEELARMLKRERLRMQLAQDRVAEARRVREAIAKGEDPYPDEGPVYRGPDPQSSSAKRESKKNGGRR